MPKPRLAQTVATYVPDFTEKSVWPRTGVPPPGSQRLAPEGTGQPQWMEPTFQLRRCPRSPGEPPGHQKAVEEGASEAHDIWHRLLLPESPLLWRARAC